jgi:hypothetical protein
LPRLQQEDEGEPRPLDAQWHMEVAAHQEVPTLSCRDPEEWRMSKHEMQQSEVPEVILLALS